MSASKKPDVWPPNECIDCIYEYEDVASNCRVCPRCTWKDWYTRCAVITDSGMVVFESEDRAEAQEYIWQAARKHGDISKLHLIDKNDAKE